MIIFDVGVTTYCGSFRSVNEDSFLLCDRIMRNDKRTGFYGLSTSKREYGVTAVFDGMGGAKYGELASGIAAEVLSESMGDILNTGRTGVEQYIQEANAKICNQSNKLNAPMGSTMVLVTISDGRAAIYNIGDSRAYMVRSGQIRQLSKDHTVAASLSAIGIDNNSDAHKNQLTQYLGIPPEEIVIQAFSLGSFELRDKDIILLCSDGVTEGLTDEEILNTLGLGESAADLSKGTVLAAVKGGSRDNITAMVLVFSDDGKPVKRNAHTKSNTSSSSPASPIVSTANQRPLTASEAGRAKIYPEPQREHKPPQQPQHDSAGTGINAFTMPKAVKNDRFALLWLISVVSSLMLGLVLGVIYNLITRM